MSHEQAWVPTDEDVAPSSDMEIREIAAKGEECYVHRLVLVLHANHQMKFCVRTTVYDKVYLPSPSQPGRTKVRLGPIGPYPKASLPW